MTFRSTSPRSAFAGDPETGARSRMPEPRPDGDEGGLLEPSAGRLRLVFVDDDPLAEMSVRRALSRLGIDVPLAVAHDGLEALEMLRNPWFPLDRCVLVVDLNMPRMDGHELIREVRADPTGVSQIPIVVMTTSDDPRDVQLAYDANVSGYFVKPSSFIDLVETVRALVDYWSRALMPRPKGRSGSFPTVP